MPNRKSGILLHITSLPCEFGIGDFGPGAYDFVNFLSNAKQRYWQILPINPTDAINEHSPYSSSSAFAGNALLISPKQLVADGFIDGQDLTDKPNFPDDRVDFKAVEEYKTLLLNLAYGQFDQKDDFNKFIEDNSNWLNDYALFVVIKGRMGGIVWTQWPDGLRRRDNAALVEFEQANCDEINRIKFIQYLFFTQWSRFKEYCSQKSIQLIGDLPIYVNFDSADVWAYPQNYKLDDNFKPTVVAGVPPDYFSDTGQRWGNPVYDWPKMRDSGFTWWVKRFEHNLKLFDIVRVDHFRGLVQCWEIPAREQTAVGGHWADVPTVEFFNTLERCFSKPLPVIAEDLGHITDDVRAMIRRFDLPGMKVLLFAFNDNLEDHPYLPHNFSGRCAVYTGTHDNNTVLGWYKEEATDKERDNLRQYLQRDVSEYTICDDLMRLAYESKAEYAIVPLQDILGLNGDSRMNKPATMNGNWQWRCSPKMLNFQLIQKLSEMTVAAGRC